MKKIITSLLLIMITMLSIRSNAQSTAEKVNQKVTETSTTITNTTQTAAAAKSAINILFPGKKGTTKKTVALFIDGIKYEDENLASLQQSLKKNSGVKSVSKSYKDGMATIDIELKNKASLSDVWDNVPPDQKKLFNIQEMSDDGILLSYKNAVPETEASNSANQ